MKAVELRKKDLKDLRNQVQDLKKKLSEARFKSAANQVKNVKETGQTKKTIARMLTIIKELEKNHA